MNYTKLPIVGKFYKKIKQKFDVLEKEISGVIQQNIELRFKLKKLNNEKINVVFVCHRPAVWGSLKTVYEAMKADESFNVKIVTIPNKKQLPDLGLNHEVYESEGAEVFWKGEDVISGYNYETKEWIDLKLLKPDYVFFQQPYNITRQEYFKSWNVAKYSKICHVEYGYISQKLIGIDCLPPDFVKNLSYLFIMHEQQRNWYTEYFNNVGSNAKMVLTGFPRFDSLSEYENCDSEMWKHKKDESFRIIWTPRWCLNESNCHFMNYKDTLMDYAKKNKDVDFMFRPHPQAFLNYVAEGIISDTDLTNYCNELQSMDNGILDKSTDFLLNFYSSDCLITDYSSVVIEYFLTGKPIIYCKNDNSIVDNEGKFTDGFYFVRNWNELENVINDLKNGIDPLYEKRMEIIKTEFYRPVEGAGNTIKNFVKQDFGYIEE